jgi:hypothetical protein
MLFCLDTSALINSWNKLYPIDVFPTFWRTLEAWIVDGRVIAPEEVLREIERKDDELYAWAKEWKCMFRPPVEEVQEELREILASHLRLLDTKRGRHEADPWVIAQAKVAKATVVTEELASTEEEPKSPKIPDMCRRFGIPWVQTLDLLRTMKLRF